jgi:hypothetical protein
MQYIDPESQPYRTYKQALQQLNEVITNGAKHLEADQRKAQKAMEKGLPPPEEDGTPPGVHGQAVDAKARLEMIRQEGLTKLEIKKQEADQKLLFNDAFAAQKLKQMSAEQQIKARQRPTA